MQFPYILQFPYTQWCWASPPSTGNYIAVLAPSTKRNLFVRANVAITDRRIRAFHVAKELTQF